MAAWHADTSPEPEDIEDDRALTYWARWRSFDTLPGGLPIDAQPAWLQRDFARLNAASAWEQRRLAKERETQGVRDRAANAYADPEHVW